MKSETTNLFDFDASKFENKNSHEFDLKILNQLKTVKCKPKDFEKQIRNIMKQKSSLKLWWDNKDTKIWSYDNKEYYDVNYRCCPQSKKARNLFCLVLNRNENEICVENGYLESV